MSIWPIPSVVIASITLYVGLYHLIVYLRRRQYRENLTFALTCFAVGVYDVYCAGLYNAASAEASLPWLRGEAILLALVAAAFGWFIADYTSHNPRRMLLSLSACFILIALAGLADRDGWLWRSEQPSLNQVSLPLLGQIMIYHAEAGPLTNLESGLGILTFVYVLSIGVRYYRTGQRRRAAPLILATVLLFAGGFSDAAVTNGLYPFPYVFEYAYLGMVLLMTYSLSDAMVQAAYIQEALRESEERYRGLVTASPDSIVLTDVRGNVLLANQQAAALHGFERIEDLIGKNALDYIIAGDRARAIKAIRRVRQAGAVQQMRYTLLTKDGGRFPAEISLSVITDKLGQVAGYIGLTRDIAERIGAEAELMVGRAKLKAIFDNAGVGIAVMDRSGYFIQVNDRLADMLGYPPEELVQKTELEVTHKDDAASSQAHMQALTSGDTDRFDMEKRYMRRDGSVFWADLCATPIYGPHGELEAVTGFITDITERKRVEDALRMTQYSLDYASETVFWVDPNGRFVYVNDAACRSLGYTRQELLNLSVPDIDPLYPKERWPAQWKDMQEQSSMTFESIHRAKDGHTFPVEITANYLDFGGKQYHHVFAHNISERKHVEEALRQSEERLSLVLEGNKDGVWDWNIVTGDIQCNRRYAEMLGYTVDELKLTVHTWEQMIHPEDRTMVNQTLAAHLEGRMSYYECEYRFRTKAGDWKWILDRGKVVERDEQGQALRMAGTHTDITDRKQVEAERERLLLDLAYRSTQLQTAAEISKSASTLLVPDALMQLAADLIKDRFGFYYVGIFLTEDDGQCAVLRAGTGEEGRQMLAEGHRLPVGSGSMIGYCIAHAQARIALEADEETIRYKNPHLPLTRSEMALPLLTRGQAIGALTVQSAHEMAFSIEDVSVLQTMADQLAIAIENAWLYEAGQQEIAKRRIAEEAVRKLNEELERRVAERTAQLQAATRELETFAYSVSHDLKAPLRGIDGYSRLLLEDYADKLDQEGHLFLNTIRQATVQMSQLIDDLLSYSRLERRSFTTGSVKLPTLIDNILAERAGDLDARRVKLSVNPPCTSVAADPAGLAQALRNLIDNAFKFTRDVAEPRIEIGGHETENACILWVRDNGVGFDMQYHDRIFEIFQRLHRVEEYPGTGVGLAIVRKAMQRMGGRVWAESAPGAGATFYLEIPKP